jgi:tRNA (uracil-5-)-methyltransferase
MEEQAPNHELQLPSKEMDDPAQEAAPGAADAGAPASEDGSERSLLIIGVHFYVTAKEIEKLFASEAPGFTAQRIKLPKHGVGQDVAVVKMHGTEERDGALAVFNAKRIELRGQQLTFRKAQPIATRIQKRKADQRDNGAGSSSEPKRLKTVEEAVTPLHAMSYDEQLALKAESIKGVLTTLAKRLVKGGFGGAWLTRYKAKQMGGRCCPQDPVVRSPVHEGYRNKCEFAIGKDEEGRTCVGFTRGRFREGATAVGSPELCHNVSSEMKRVVQVVCEAVDKTKLPVFNSADNAGFWRQLLVRQNRQGELLLSLQVGRRARARDSTRDIPTPPPPDLAASLTPLAPLSPPHTHARALQVNPAFLSKEEVRAAVEEVAGAVKGEGLAKCAYFQAYAGCSTPPADLPHTHLWGEHELHEQLNGVRFCISPNAFFQVNTAAAERMGDVLEEMVLSVSKRATLLDVCCGAGAWGLCLASKVLRVVGVELCADAIQDARRNARANGITNAEFQCGKAEDLLPSLLPSLSGSECVAIVDPPRPGLHVNVLKGLRACSSLHHLIYVSCNPSSWVEDSEKLCRTTSKQYRGHPFRPVRAVPVDLFPYTAHCELVVHMVRLPADQPTYALTSAMLAGAPAAAAPAAGAVPAPVQPAPAAVPVADAAPPAVEAEPESF